MSENMNEQDRNEQAETPPPAAEQSVPPEPVSPGPAAPQPAAPRRGGCARGCLLVTVAIIGSIVGALVASTFVPWALGIPPWKLFDQAFIAKTLGGDRQLASSMRTIISGDTTSAPVVAVAAKVSPSVVYIRTRQTADGFFGQQTVEGEGSGVIYRSDGYIVTNNHVVAGAQQVFVSIDGEAPIAGQVKGTDPESDLAIVKVNRKGLAAADFGDSSKLVVGEVAVAVGAPFGLEKSVTEGVISALHRNIVMQNETGQTSAYANLIQTDAAINPGNSGGALSNSRGQVVGINALIKSGSQASPSSAGVGFAIPSNFVLGVVRQLMAGKTVGHAYIGVVPADVKPSTEGGTARTSQGALVSRVLPNGPAAKAGIKAGDIIVKMGDASIKTREDLFATVRSHQPGDKVDVELVGENGTKRTVTVTLAERPEATTPPEAGTPR